MVWKPYAQSRFIDPATIFSTFHMGQLAKREIHRHRWKGRLKIRTIARFESDGMKTKEDMAPKRRKIL